MPTKLAMRMPVQGVDVLQAELGRGQVEPSPYMPDLAAVHVIGDVQRLQRFADGVDRLPQVCLGHPRCRHRARSRSGWPAPACTPPAPRGPRW